MQVRYTAVRRQTAARQGEREVQVLDYQNTAFELLPLLATAYALVFMVGSQPPPLTCLLHGTMCEHKDGQFVLRMH